MIDFAFGWIGLALNWLFDGIDRIFRIISLPRFDLPAIYPGGEDWRASSGTADVRRRSHEARSLAGRRVSGAICSGDLGAQRLMLVG